MGATSRLASTEPLEEPLPDAQEVGFVRKAVGDNFHGLVLNAERDVLVLFYLPTCQNCRVRLSAACHLSCNNNS